MVQAAFLLFQQPSQCVYLFVAHQVQAVVFHPFQQAVYVQAPVPVCREVLAVPSDGGFPQQCDSDNVAAYGVDFIPDLTYFCGSVCYVMHFFALMEQYGNHASDDCQQYQITSYDFCLQ